MLDKGVNMVMLNTRIVAIIREIRISTFMGSKTQMLPVATAWCHPLLRTLRFTGEKSIVLKFMLRKCRITDQKQAPSICEKEL